MLQVVVPSGSGPWGGLQTPDGRFYVSVQGSGSFVEQEVRGASLALPLPARRWLCH